MLPIGGLKEKILAAHRGQIKTVIIPKDNEKDLCDIPKKILNNLTVKAVDHMDEVLEISLMKDPEHRVVSHIIDDSEKFNRGNSTASGITAH